MEHEVSLPCSQNPIRDPYQSSLCLPSHPYSYSFVPKAIGYATRHVTRGIRGRGLVLVTVG